MIDAVIFDLDDTLLKTRETKYKALKFAGKKFYNLDISTETLDTHWGKPYLEFMGLVFESVEHAETISKKYKSIVKQFINKPYSDAISTIDTLLDSYKVGILTSTSRSIVMYDIKHAGLPVERFVYIQTAEDTNVHKPDPSVFDPMNKIMSKYSIQPDSVLYVGDMLSDYEAAVGAGLHFVAIADRSLPKSTFEEKGICSIDTLSELPDLIGSNTFL